MQVGDEFQIRPFTMLDKNYLRGGNRLGPVSRVGGQGCGKVEMLHLAGGEEYLEMRLANHRPLVTSHRPHVGFDL